MFIKLSVQVNYSVFFMIFMGFGLIFYFWDIWVLLDCCIFF